VLAVTVGAGQQAGKHYQAMKMKPAADASVCVVGGAGAPVCVGAKLVAARDMIRRFSRRGADQGRERRLRGAAGGADLEPLGEGLVDGLREPDHGHD